QDRLLPIDSAEKRSLVERVLARRHALDRQLAPCKFAERAEVRSDRKALRERLCFRELHSPGEQRQLESIESLRDLLGRRRKCDHHGSIAARNVEVDVVSAGRGNVELADADEVVEITKAAVHATDAHLEAISS